MFVVTANALCTLADAFSRNKEVGAICMCVCVCVRAGERVFSLCYWLPQFLNERSALFFGCNDAAHFQELRKLILGNWSYSRSLLQSVFRPHTRTTASFPSIRENSATEHISCK